MQALPFPQLFLRKVLMRDLRNREISYLRLSVTDKCNLRCRYCMPEEVVCLKSGEELLSEEEMLLAVEAAAAIGIRKVRITGGEPLVKENILSICRRTAAVEGIEEVVLTTNGILLPQYAQALREAGVKRVNISLDTLDPRKYAQITRTGKLDEALDGLKAALEAGFDKVKVNAVLIGGFNEEEIADIANLSVRYPIEVRFIELMPMEGIREFGPEAYVPCDKVLKVLPDLEYAGEDNHTRQYRLPGAQGTIGLITPISNHFCAACDRIRLTADGKLKPCLHSGAEYSVKGLSKEEMIQVFRTTVLGKPAGHGELTCNAGSHAKRSMNRIGG